MDLRGSESSILKNYANKFSVRQHLLNSGASLTLYVSIIIFAFIPLTEQIGTSGYSTMDLQGAESREIVDQILVAFQPVMDEVRLLSLADYIFIIAGFFLFFSVHSLVLLMVPKASKYELIPQGGMILTIISRSLDSLENLWVILMYSNPEGYPSFLIPLTNITETAKWFIVGIEYAVFFLSIIIGLIFKFYLSKE